jgi:PAS domain S-box-containing protein
VGRVLQELVKWLVINVAVVFTASYLAFRPSLWSAEPRILRLRLIAVSALLGSFSMLFPWEVTPGIFIDIRSVVVALSGWLGGWTVSLPVAVLVGVVRLLMGGPGAVGGAATILGAGIVGAFLYGRAPRPLNYLLLGWSLVVLLFLGGFLIEDRPSVVHLNSPIYPVVIVLFPIAAWILHRTMTEVEERHRLAESLQQELRLNEAVLETVPSAVVVTDSEGRIQKANRQAARLLSIEETMLGRPIGELLPEAVRQSMVETGAAAPVRATVGERSLLFFWSRLSKGGAVVTVQDVTRVIAEEQADAHRKRLESLGELAAMAAHEIKNPLTTIKGFLQLLSVKAEFRRYERELGLIHGEVEQINRVVGDFLLLSRYKADDLNRLDLGELVAEVLTLLRMQYPAASVEMKAALEPGLGLVSDRKALKQVLLNLAVNSIEAMDWVGRLQISAVSSGTDAVIEVADSGPGLPAELLPDLFRPYVTTKATGTGLGLAICNRLITELGGTIEAGPAEGGGALFRVRLPREPSMARTRSAQS